ncbi:hypothetical protein AB0I60_37000 [Actinosynnema sp. NPDC050436]|uniref:hypothetical protein n=1 Tax=Actinosynnema sp. NPDC050436 TaxID=3155659 RepID=UPI0033F47790
MFRIVAEPRDGSRDIMAVVGTRRRPVRGRDQPGQHAVAADAAQVLQAGRDLYVLQQVVHRRLDEQRKVLADADVRPRSLPATVAHVLRSPMRGRQEDLAFLRDNVRAGRHVVVVGPGGAGKSTLLKHAANEGDLAAARLAGAAGVVWVDCTARTAPDVVRDLVQECYEVDADVLVPDGVARRLLGDVRALVVLDGVDLPPEQVQSILSVMHRSVFVLSSRGEGLWDTGVQRPLGGLPFADSLAMVVDVVDGPVDVETVERDWAACGGNARKLLERTSLRHAARVLGALPQEPTKPQLLELLVPIVVGTLDGPALATLSALTALGDVQWGTGLLAEVCDAPAVVGADRLVEAGLAHCDGDRCRASSLVAESAPVETALSLLVDRIALWAQQARPDALVAEMAVVATALRRALDAGAPDSALSLAWAAARGLAWSRHWGALSVVLTLGLRAAVGAKSVRHEAAFRSALALCEFSDRDDEQAAEILVGAMALAGDDRDEHLAARVREGDAEVQLLAGRAPLSTVDKVLARIAEAAGAVVPSVAAGAKAARDACATAVSRVPGGAQLVRLVQENPGLLRGLASATAVAGLVLATMSASGNHEPATAAPPGTGVPPAQALPGGATTTTVPPAPTTTTPSRSPAGVPPTAGQVTTTGRGTGTGVGSVPAGGDPGYGRHGTDGTSTSGPTPPPTVPATWAFARVWYVDRPIGSTHALSGPSAPNNDEANWTYDPAQMSPSPTAYPTVTHVAPGRHRVRIPGVGAPGGSVKVTAQDWAAWSGTPRHRIGVFCQPSGWHQDGPDEVVDVACFERGGASADVPFLLRFVAGSGSAGRGFVLADQPGAASFTPDWRHGVNAGDVTRTGPGRYTAVLRGSARGAVEVTAVGAAPVHCTLSGRRGDLADVACVTPSGAATDSAFTATFAVAQNVLDDARKPVGDYLVTDDTATAATPTITTQWASGGAPLTLERTSTGRYKAHFTNGYIRSTMHVTAGGYGNYCTVMLFNDYSFPNNATVYVACFDHAGTPVNTGFTLVYTSARIY